MSELLNGIFECLDINSSTGLATEDSLQSMSPFQRLFYTQVHEKIGIDAVYFLRDANGIAKVPLIYFSVIQKYDAKQVAELHRLSWNLGEAPLLFVVTPDEILIYNNYESYQIDDVIDYVYDYFKKSSIQYPSNGRTLMLTNSIIIPLVKC